MNPLAARYKIAYITSAQTTSALRQPNCYTLMIGNYVAYC